MNTMNLRISQYTLRAALLLPSALFLLTWVRNPIALPSAATGLGAFWLYARKARGVALDRDARAAGGCLHPAAFAAAGGHRLRTAVEVPLRHRWLLLPK